MSITRWDPWSEMMSLREAMDQLLRESFVRPATSMLRSGSLGMGIPLDVRETDDAYIVKATMPGVRPDDVSIQITGNTLQISGETREEYEQSEGAEEGRDRGTWLVRERRYGRFERTITLPTDVKADQAQATLEHGVLTLRLPKAEEARARRIPVQSGTGAQQIEAQSRPRS
ncbi:Hsp20/alpha crystallin family protein [Sphaerobacter thermophilus]|uniref:Hsp20/alpha crystallin family protein n=1 Tax=Sphaerobacter thermophilus TaxID=2057 RepID=UPI000DB3C2FF|nr:MAG: heat-shock protein Hsp20 [Sphaerobacter thermophilus]